MLSHSYNDITRFEPFYASAARVIELDRKRDASIKLVSELSPRERDVLEAGADGSTIADIAGRLHLSEGTVRNYLSSAINKVGARNRIEAVHTARAQGWL